jgi:hypothetical protein
MARITWSGAVTYAAAAGRHASAWWVAVVGGLAGAAYLWASGMSSLLTQHLPADPLIASALTLLLCVVAGVATVFVLLLCVYPVHAAFEERGGVRAVLKQRLGKHMWPVVLMASGISAFVLLFGTGVILLALRVPSPDHPTTPLGTAAADVINKLSAIDEARSLVDETMRSQINEAVRIQNSWSRVAADTMPRLVDELQQLCVAINESYLSLEKIRYKYRYYDDIPNILTGAPDKDELAPLESSLVNALNLRAELMRTNAKLTNDVDSPLQAFMAWIIKLNLWENEADKNLIFVRRRLSR